MKQTMKYVVYLRVSTKGQGESGLGIEAQQRDIDLFLTQYSDRPFDVIEVIEEHKSAKGMLTDRAGLTRAVELCEQHGAVLLVAKLDRLSRDVETVAHLIKRVDLKVACMPFADRFQLHLYAALAEQEKMFISQRTKAALQSAKARGVKLGGTREGREKAAQANQQAADERAEGYRAEIVEMRKHGYSHKRMAESLNQRGIRTQTGKTFHATGVARLIKRLGL